MNQELNLILELKDCQDRKNNSRNSIYKVLKENVKEFKNNVKIKNVKFIYTNIMTNLQEILNSYNNQGNHDRDLLMVILSAKKAEDEVSCLLLVKNLLF